MSDPIDIPIISAKGLVRGPVYVIEYDYNHVSPDTLHSLCEVLDTYGIKFALAGTFGGQSIHIHEPHPETSHVRP
jgi:hypothetical protein